MSLDSQHYANLAEHDLAEHAPLLAQTLQQTQAFDQQPPQAQAQETAAPGRAL